MFNMLKYKYCLHYLEDTYKHAILKELGYFLHPFHLETIKAKGEKIPSPH